MLLNPYRFGMAASDLLLMAVAHSNAPYITIYNTADWSKLADPAVRPAGTGNGVAFNPSGTLMAVSCATTPFVTIYNTSDWSKLANPAVLPTNTGYGVAFSPV